MWTKPVLGLYVLVSYLALFVHSKVVTPPGQPTQTGKPGTFEIIGDSLVSAQQVLAFDQMLQETWC